MHFNAHDTHVMHLTLGHGLLLILAEFESEFVLLGDSFDLF